MTDGEATASVLLGLILAALLTGGLGLSTGSAIMDSIPTQPDCTMDHIINLTECP